MSSSVIWWVCICSFDWLWYWCTWRTYKIEVKGTIIRINHFHIRCQLRGEIFYVYGDKYKLRIKIVEARESFFMWQCRYVHESLLFHTFLPFSLMSMSPDRFGFTEFSSYSVRILQLKSYQELVSFCFNWPFWSRKLAFTTFSKVPCSRLTHGVLWMSCWFGFLQKRFYFLVLIQKSSCRPFCWVFKINWIFGMKDSILIHSPSFLRFLKLRLNVPHWRI